MRASSDERRRRAAAARERLAACDLCPRRCGVNRLAGEPGFCGLGGEGRWYRELLHLGDEPEISPTHLIDLAGCSLRCAHCSEADFVREPLGSSQPLQAETMAGVVARRRREGARSLSLAGGEPLVQLPAAFALLAALPQDTHVVWNSNLWCDPGTVAELVGFVDLVLADLKFGHADCAERLAETEDYVGRVRDNLRLAHDLGLRLIVRHLLLPGHFECCTEPTLEWLRRELPGATVNVMSLYVPFARMGREVAPPRMLSLDERARALTRLRALDFPDARLDGQPV